MRDIAGEAGQRPAGGLRVELLRFVALAILIGNLVLGADHGASVQTAVVVAYLAVSAASALTVLFGMASRWMRTGSSRLTRSLWRLFSTPSYSRLRSITPITSRRRASWWLSSC